MLGLGGSARSWVTKSPKGKIRSARHILKTPKSRLRLVYALDAPVIASYFKPRRDPRNPISCAKRPPSQMNKPNIVPKKNPAPHSLEFFGKSIESITGKT